MRSHHLDWPSAEHAHPPPWVHSIGIFAACLALTLKCEVVVFRCVYASLIQSRAPTACVPSLRLLVAY
jgi:hypothetical protein